MSFFIRKLKFLAELPWKSNLKPLSRNFCDRDECCPEEENDCNSTCEDDDSPKIKKEARLISKKEALMTPEDLIEQCRHTQTIEVEEPSKINRFNGVPVDHVASRRVRICKPSKNAMQSGTDNIQMWQMEFETRDRWQNPLMGWTSSGDPLSNMTLQFPTKEETIAFCEKNCWPYYVEEKVEKPMKVKPYANIFAWNRRSRASTK